MGNHTLFLKKLQVWATEVHRLLEKGRRWTQGQPFIKYKERFQELEELAFFQVPCPPQNASLTIDNLMSLKFFKLLIITLLSIWAAFLKV
jgi:hypothetical protein